MGGCLVQRVIATIGISTATALSGNAPAAAQALGSAEATAAARVNPSWAPPRTPWGHPDLQGIWTTDDMRGIPQSRPEQYGTRT
jgi:hypothetical protein